MNARTLFSTALRVSTALRGPGRGRTPASLLAAALLLGASGVSAQGWTEVPGPHTVAPGSARGAAFIDFDEDGDQDLFQLDAGGTRRFRNDGGGVFTSIGGIGSGVIFGEQWFDHDGDGDLDLYIGSASSANQLWDNQGGGVYSNIAAGALADAVRINRDVAAGDYDGDGDLDLYLIADEGGNLLRNDGGGVFTDVTPPALDIIGDTASFADIDGDGDVDLLAGQTLFRNDGGGVFTDITPAALAGMVVAVDCDWADFDQDGDLDLVVAGLPCVVFTNDGTGVFGNFSVNAGNPRDVVWGDVNNDGFEDLFVSIWTAANKLYINNGAGGLVDATPVEIAVADAANGAAMGDHNQDGLLDIYWTAFEGSHLLENSQVVPGEYLLVDLQPSVSNPDAIGARVRAFAGSNVVTRFVTSENGAGQPYTLHFGLGAASGLVDSLKVDWPSGKRTEAFAVAVGQKVTLAEPPPVRITVTTLLDEDDGLLGDGTGVSLREAVAYSSVSDTVDFAGPGSYELYDNDLDIPHHLVIEGLPGNGVIFQGATFGAKPGVGAAATSFDRLVEVPFGVTLEVSNVVFQGGGDIFVGPANGGNLLNAGEMILTECRITDGGATTAGGGIYNTGLLTLYDCLVDANAAQSGGGIHCDAPGQVRAYNTTISGNSAAADGGGVNASSQIELIYATVTGNTADQGGGAAGGAALILHNSLVAGNTAVLNDPDVYIGYTPVGYNIIGNAFAVPLGPNDLDLGGASANLGALTDNGGATLTHLPLAGSPAIDFVPPGSCFLGLDARGQSRPQGAGCDVGAVEAVPVGPERVTVTTLADEDNEALGGGAGVSLREALIYSAPGDTVDFAVTGTINLTLGQLVFDHDLYLEGAPGQGVEVNGGAANRCFLVPPGVTVEMIDMVVANGRTFGFGTQGGNIRNEGTLTVRRSHIREGYAESDGGAFFNTGTLVVEGCLIQGNTADYDGAGLRNDGAGLSTFRNCTVTGGFTGFSGAGLRNVGANPVVVEFCTITGNAANLNGGALEGQFTLLGNIIAGNVAVGSGPDILGTMNSLGGNVIGSTANNSGWIGSDVVDTDPLLGPLQDNGGPFETFAITAASPAYNLAATCTVVEDNRGVPRPLFGDCDAGSFEVNTLPAPTISSNLPNAVRLGDVVTITFTGDNLAQPILGAFLQDPVTEDIIFASSTNSPDNNTLEIEFDFTGAELASYGLNLTVTAGSVGLSNTVLVHDEDADFRRITTGFGQEIQPAWRSSGSVFAYVEVGDGLNIVERDSSDPGDFGAVVVAGSGHPSYSSDRRYLAFDDDGSVEVWDFVAGSLLALPGNPSGDTPEINPANDEEIAYVDFTGIAVYNRITGTVRQVTTHPGAPDLDYDPSWSPDGTKLAFARRVGGIAAVFVVDAIAGEAGGLTQVSEAGGNIFDLEWSPDGRLLAFASDRLGSFNIWVTDARGAWSQDLAVTDDFVGDRNPTWTPDGLGIAFDSDRPGGGNRDIILATNIGALVDTDGDLLPDGVDACPTEVHLPGQFDLDFDGCVDQTSSFRQVRFWSPDQYPVDFETDAIADPTISDGSEFSILSAALGQWRDLPGVTITGGDDGSRAGPANATSGDGRNSITFSDPDGYLPGILAITPSTVAAADTFLFGRWYRPGEIVDADILFNSSNFTFQTPSFPGPAGSFDLESVAVHEFGHYWGHSHTWAEGTTMFYVVPLGTGAATLEADDAVLMNRGYGSFGIQAAEGTVLRPDGATPVAGAALTAVSSATGLPLQTTFSDGAGQYRFYDIGEDYRIYVQPLNGGADVNGLTAAGVNQLLDSVAETDFLAEYVDLAESNGDFGSPGAVFIGGAITLGANVVLNLDTTAPTVVSTSPADGEPAAPVVGAITAKFDEKIDPAYFASNPEVDFRPQGGSGLGGVAAILGGDSLLVFTPTAALEYDTVYEFTVGPDIRDVTGNPMAAATVATFTTGPQPPASIESITSSEVPVGASMVIYGSGFDADAASNAVNFPGAAPIVPDGATPDRLFVTVPPDATSGSLTVDVGASTSNAVPVTILPPKAPPTGNFVDDVGLGQNPRRVSVKPDATWAYVATDGGVVAVNSLPTDPGFLTTTPIPVAGGCADVAALPSGRRAVALGTSPARLLLIDTDPASSTFHQVIDTASLVAAPRGVAVVPGGAEIVVSYTDRVVLHSVLAGTGFGSETRDWSQAGTTFRGEVAVSATGAEAYAATAGGKIAVCSLILGEDIEAFLNAGTMPNGIAANALTGSFVAVDGDGTGRLFDTRGPQQGLLTPGGAYRGVAVSPEGAFSYAANFTLNRIDIWDHQSGGFAAADMFDTGIDPVDVATGQAGRYIYVVTQASDLLEVYDTESGPRMASLSPSSGGGGTLLTVAGSGFDPVPANNTVTVGGIPAAVLSVNPGGTALTVSVAPGSLSGAVQVTVGGQQSNTLPFKYMERQAVGSFEFTANFPVPGVSAASDLIISPDGKLLVAFLSDGTVQVVREDPTAADFHRVVQTLNPAQSGLPGGNAWPVFTPDGSRLYVAMGNVHVFDVEPAASAPITPAGLVDDDGSPLSGAARPLSITPDGTRIYGLFAGATGFEIDTASDSVTNSFSVALPSTGFTAMHPDGSRLYVATGPVAGACQVAVVDILPGSPGYLTQVTTVVLTGNDGPYSMTTDPTGRFLFAAVRTIGVDRYISQVTISPALPGVNTETDLVPLGPTGSFMPTLVAQKSGFRLFSFDPDGLRVEAWNPDNLGFTSSAIGGPDLAADRGMVLSRDDGRLYLPTGGGQIRTVDMGDHDDLVVTSGATQTGVAGEPLAQPLTVRLELFGGVGEGTPVLFTSPNGDFGFGDGTLWTTADAAGYASADYIASPVSTGTDTVTVSMTTGTSSTFFTVLPDTTLAAPVVVSTKPVSGGTPGVNTTVSADFSKSINPATVGTAGFQLREPGGPAIAGVFTYAQAGRRVVFIPDNSLDYSTAYEFELTSGLQDYDGNPLATPTTIGFTTTPPDAPEVFAVQASSAKVGSPVVISGQGFDPVPSNNTVLFGTKAATPTSGDPGALTVLVPIGASSGDLRVAVGPDTSNAKPFTVVTVPVAPVAGVTETANVPTSGQQIAVIPDGSRAYMTSPSANSVVPIDVASAASEPSIAVGLYPFGVASSPTGDRVYATNYFSNDVSVIDAVPTSPTFQDVIAVMPSGLNPSGVAAHPDGRTLYVTNYGDSTLTMFDTDSTSAGAYSARTTINTGSSSQTVVVTPDGGSVVIGTAEGLLIVDAVDGAARTTINTGSSSQSVVVTPDGGFAVVLTTDGLLQLIDIVPGSANEGAARTTINTGESSQTIVVSPDGGSVYVSQADGTVDVYAIVTVGGGGAAADPLSSPYEFQLVAEIQVGENPTGMAFDTENNQLLVVNSGEKTVSFVGVFDGEVGLADFTIEPNRINLKSKGKYVTARLYFPPFLDPADVDVTSLVLAGTLGPDTTKGGVEIDENGDEHFVAKFFRQELYDAVPEGQDVVVVITGEVGGIPFTSTVPITLFRPGQVSPAAEEVVLAVSEYEIRWTPNQNGGGATMDIFWTWGQQESGEAVWDTVVTGTPDDSSYVWSVPETSTSEARIMLASRNADGEVIGVTIMEETFIVAATLDNPGPEVPVTFALRAPMPNPFLGSTRVRFALPQRAPVSLEVFSVDGRLVRRLASSEDYPAGTHELTWDGTDEQGRTAGHGVYFIRLRTPENRAVQKVIRLR